MAILHPAYTVVEAAERCWSADATQAAERARVIVARLAEAGLLVNATRDGEFYTRTNAIAGETPRRGLAG